METKLSEIYINRWEPLEEPIGIVQIIHGMGEHSKRYDELARYLNNEGYLVVATDHRGHGKSIEDMEKLGRVEGGFEALVTDEVELTKNLILECPKTPIYILGHSMGSFIAQGHMKASMGFRGGYILSGSCKVPYLKTLMGSKLAKTIEVVTGNKKSKLLDKLLFAGYNKKVKDRKTKFDWLSRDADVVEKYIEDLKCGFVYSAGFYASFLKCLSELFIDDGFKFLDKTLPIFIFSGDKDPVGLYGEGVKELYNFYENSGYKNIHLKLYVEGRHEMLNEVNKVEVFEDILEFIKNNVRLPPYN